MYETFYAVLYHRPVPCRSEWAIMSRPQSWSQTQWNVLFGFFFQLDGDFIHYFLSLSASVALSFKNPVLSDVLNLYSS